MLKKRKKLLVFVMMVFVMASLASCSKSSNSRDSTPIIFNVSPLGCEYNVGGYYDQVAIYWTIQYTNPSDKNTSYFATIEWGDGKTDNGGDELPRVAAGGTVTQRISHIYPDVPRGQSRTFEVKVTFTYWDHPEIDPVVRTISITISRA